MSDRKAIALVMLLLSLSAASLVANATALPSAPGRLSNFRTAVVETKALVDKGDLIDATARIEDLDTSSDHALAGSAPHAVANWRLADRAIDRGLDRALFALRSPPPNTAMCKKALVDLLAVVDQVRKNHASADGGRP